ncbi:MAG TPA: J domain-containing protein, partial [Polyangiaceae bacterium]
FHVRRPGRPAGPRPWPLTPAEFLHGRARARSRVRPAPSIDSAARLEAYRVLGVPPLAPLSEVRRAFRLKAADAHPDRDPQASPEEKSRRLKRFAELSAAYHLLVR